MQEMDIFEIFDLTPAQAIAWDILWNEEQFGKGKTYVLIVEL